MIHSLPPLYQQVHAFLAFCGLDSLSNSIIMPGLLLANVLIYLDDSSWKLLRKPMKYWPCDSFY